MATPLLDPTNDYVFKRLFAEAPDLLVALINDLRPDLPDITSVDVTNPNIESGELAGKYIILDVLARDQAGHCYNVEIQVRRYDAWHQRGLFYLASLLSKQLNAGEDYRVLNSAIGLHLLDFDLFTATEEERQQAIWRFEMRDATQPWVSLGNLLQMNLIELKKADRLGVASGPLRAWVHFFEHGEKTMSHTDLEYPPVHQAMERLKQLSADEETRRLALIKRAFTGCGVTYPRP